MTHVALNVSLRLDTFELAVTHDLPLQGITALFGPSGCGKTTLLRIISGLEHRASGTIDFASEPWQGPNTFVAPHRRGVGYVFQDARLFPFLNAAGNLRYAEKRSRNAPANVTWKDVVEALDLAPLLDRRPGSLSGGERQRVAIGRTLLTRPRLLLMDEPLAALDLRRKAEILPYIEKLPATFGVPIVYVTHSIDEVVRLADRMIVLADGKKIADGGVAETLERPDLQIAVGRFEAGVVIDATITDHDRHYRLTALEHAGQSIVMPMVEAPVGTALRLRIRARDVSVAVERPRGISVRNILAGTVEEIVEEPGTAFAELMIDIGEARLRSRVTREAVADLKLEVGQPIYALVKSIAFDRRIMKHVVE